MINSRSKGRAAEQEICRLLKDELRIDVRRNWMAQNAQAGNCDITDVPGWAIEIKRHKTLARWNDWWTQACAQALQIQRKPVLLMRADRQPWYAMVSLYHLRPELHDHHPCTMPISSWCKLVRLELDAAKS